MKTRYTRRVVVRGAAAAVSTAAGLSLLSCSSRRTGSATSRGPGAGASTGTIQTGGTLNWPQVSQIPYLDPQVHAGSSDNSFFECMSTPFRFKAGTDPKEAANHDVENNVAISAESPDAVTWTVKLRRDVKFHNIAPVNGHPLEAADIKATYQRVFKLPNGALAGPLGMIDPNQIEAPAADTVVFKLKYPYAPFVHTLASAMYSEILPREALAGAYDPTKQVIGSGPFILGNYTPDVGITLTKNPEHFEKGLPHIDGAYQPIIPDRSQQLAQFSTGHLDFLLVVENDIETARKSNPKATVLTGTSGGNIAMYFQLGDPASPFKDIRLRRAVSMAVDRDAIGKVVYNDHYQPFFSVKTYMGKWALSMNDLTSDQRQYYKFDLAAAKKLLNEAGGSSLNIKLAYYTGGGGADASYVTAAQTIYNMLKQLPWQINLVNIDYSKDFINGGKGWRYGNIPNDAILIGGIAPFSEADEYVFGYYHSKSTANQEHLKDAQLDSMIDKARTVVDEQSRLKAYLDIQKYIAGQMFSVAGLPAGNNYSLIQPSVHDFKFTYADGNYADVWSNLWLQK